MEWEVDKAMREWGLNPFELSEFDADIVNPATRRDLERLSREDVFGFKVWSYEVVPAERLRDVGAFEIDVVIEGRYRREVEELVEAHKKGLIDDYEYLDRVFELACYVCSWV